MNGGRKHLPGVEKQASSYITKTVLFVLCHLPRDKKKVIFKRQDKMS